MKIMGMGFRLGLFGVGCGIILGLYAHVIYGWIDRRFIAKFQPPPPAHPVSVTDITTWFTDEDQDGRVSIGDLWHVSATLTQSAACERREIDRWFWSTETEARWRQAPTFAERSDGPVPASKSSPTTDIEGAVWAQVTYRIDFHEVGRYAPTMVAYGCSNGFAGEFTLYDIPLDWRDRAYTEDDLRVPENAIIPPPQ